MRVEIQTGSRLHFGLLCPSSNQRWYYGGIGMMIQDPGCRLSIATLPGQVLDRLCVAADVSARVEKFLADFRAAAALHPAGVVLPAVSVTSDGDVALHSGLGTGTQLTLALAAGCRVLSGQGISADVSEMARQFGRRRRSAVGTMGFARGGLLVDYGRWEDRVERIHFPEQWRLVLIRPRQFAGLSGDSEETFFGDRKPLNQSTLFQLVEQIEEQIVPAIQSCQFEKFATALQVYGDIAGADFAEIQGGLFSSSVVRRVLKELESFTTFTAVQSSWGPTVCLPVESDHAAQDLVHHLHPIVDDSVAEVLVTSARNEGASIRTDSDFSQRALG